MKEIDLKKLSLSDLAILASMADGDEAEADFEEKIMEEVESRYKAIKAEAMRPKIIV